MNGFEIEHDNILSMCSTITFYDNMIKHIHQKLDNENEKKE